VWQELARQQAGTLTRAQLRALGVTDAAIEANLRARRWQRLWPGIYATFSGPLPRSARLWAVVLRTGDGAVLSHETAAELCGLVDRPAPAVHVSVPHPRRPVRTPGVVVHRTDRSRLARHPSRLPPQTRVEHTVVDLTQTARTLEDAIGWVARAVGARLTTVPRLADVLRRRPRVRWRLELTAALDDVVAGCHSVLELDYVRNVERAHGLPPADRQASFTLRRIAIAEGIVIRVDVRYGEYRTVVELDGRIAHPDHLRFRDMRRDNAAVAEGRMPLRYGPGDVAQYPCHVALQVATVLTIGGWTGRPHPCGRPGCVVPP
jgi:hypothetical protein